jgi:hypothetical protein
MATEKLKSATRRMGGNGHTGDKLKNPSTNVSMAYLEG